MPFKQLAVISVLFFSTISGYIYKVENLQVSLPGKHPITVFLLHDFHASNPASHDQLAALIQTAHHIGKDRTCILAEDNCCYNGDNTVVLNEIDDLKAEMSVDHYFLRDLVQFSRSSGSTAKNIDKKRFHRFEDSKISDVLQEYMSAHDRVSAYNDCSELSALYEQHLADPLFDDEELLAALVEHAQDPQTQDMTLFEFLTDYYVSSKLDILEDQGTISPYTDIRAISPTILTPLEEDRNAALVDICDYLGSEFVEIEALHQLYRLPDSVNTVFVCAGGAHTKRLSELLKQLSCNQIASMGADTTAENPVDLHHFFRQYMSSNVYSPLNIQAYAQHAALQTMLAAHYNTATTTATSTATVAHSGQKRDHDTAAIASAQQISKRASKLPA